MSGTAKIQKAAILLNLAAGGGRSKKIWPQIKAEVLQQLPEQTFVIPFDGQIDLKAQLYELMQTEGVNCFIAAGGDGSVHCLLNDLMELSGPGSPPVFLGAIGLGSSNDFHKPRRTMTKGIPRRIGWNNTSPVDLGLVRFRTKKGDPYQRYFLINASLGVTAAANYFFNEGDRMIRFLKRQWTGGAIMYAAVKTILSYQNYPATLLFDQRREEISVSNLAVLKNPHISGNLCYDQDIGPADGQLGLNYCDNMSRLELIRTLSDLSQGRFSGPIKRHSHLIEALQIQVDHPVPLEADGEVYVGTDFEFSILPKGINLLTNEP